MSDGLDDALRRIDEHGGLGLPLPAGTPHRFVRRLAVRAAWPVQRHQIDVNVAVVEALRDIAERLAAIERVQAEHAAAIARLADVPAATVVDGDGATAIVRRGELEATAMELHRVREVADDAVRSEALRMTEQLHEAVLWWCHDLTVDLHEREHEWRATLDQVRHDLAAAIGSMEASLRSEMVEAAAADARRDLDLAEVVAAWRALAGRSSRSLAGGGSASSFGAGPFGGRRDEVVDRCRSLLPVLGEVGGPVVDLGSGRGEWLEVLQSAGRDAAGVEPAPGLVAEAVAAGADVVLGRPVEHLRARPDGSAAAVTAVHLVDRISVVETVDVIREAARVLRPDGVLLLVMSPTSPVELVLHVLGDVGFTRADRHLVDEVVAVRATSGR